jgi:hypothetical protein
MEHDDVAHPGFSRTFRRVNDSYFIKKLGKHIREYIKYCKSCDVNNTRRHAPYGSLQPINSPPAPFHTISIDFIMAIPTSTEGHDCLMSVTCKFSKKISLIPGMSTWTAQQWADRLIERLWIMDWGPPKQIVSDRDRKFLSELWKQIFSRIGVSLLFSTAYHPQTDGASEMTNQRVEIAFRHYFLTLEDPKAWPRCLPQLQHAFNNSETSTGQTPNEICFGFTPNFNFNTQNTPLRIFPEARSDVRDAIDLAKMAMKHAYDQKHRPLYLKVGDWVNIRLHKGYNIPAVKNKKLGEQYAGPVKVIERVGRLAYRLELPHAWKVYNVFTIAQLEPTSHPSADPYQRLHDESDRHEVDADQDLPSGEHEVMRVLDKMVYRSGRGGKGQTTKYLLRWKGYGKVWDEWVNIKNCNCAELIKEYEDSVANWAWTEGVIF